MTKNFRQLPRNNEIDRSWLSDMQELCLRGNGHATFTLGQYAKWQGEEEKAMKYFVKAEEQGDIQARYQLAVAFYDGIGVPVDLVKGFKYMLSVAENGCDENGDIQPTAQFNVGMAYYQGFGVKQSYKEAVKWWVKSAESGSSPGSQQSQGMLGMYYSRIESQDLEKAFHWHSNAAENGYTSSMAALGQLHLDGHGCKRSEDLGLEWLKRAAERGSTYGTGLLSLAYYKRKLYSKALEQAQKISGVEEASDVACCPASLVARGRAMASFVIARCFQTGQSVDQQLEKAQEFYQKATAYDKDLTHALYQKATLGQM